MTTQDSMVAQQTSNTAGLFRPKGIIAFMVLILLLAGGVLLSTGSLLKSTIEHVGSWYWGAQIDVEAVEVQWHPFQLQINRLQATDPQQPTNNLLVVAQAAVSLDLWQLLLGRVLVDELLVDNIQLHVKRDQPGWVAAVDDPQAVQLVDPAELMLDVTDTMRLALPDIDELMTSSDLETIKASASLREVYQGEQTKLLDLRQQLPDQARLHEYQVALKNITQVKITNPAQLAALKQQLTLLKERVTEDKQRLVSVKQQLAVSKQKIMTAIEALRHAPQQDITRLKARYAFDELGAKNYVQLLFGDQTAEYYQSLQTYYQRFEPMLIKLLAQAQSSDVGSDQPQTSGYYVHFEQQNPLPNWLVKTASISFTLDAGHVQLIIKELTAQHWLRNQPTEWLVKSDALFGSANLELNGQLSVAEQGNIQSEAKWLVEALAVSDWPVKFRNQSIIRLERGEWKIQGQLVQQQKRLISDHHLMLSNAQWISETDEQIAKLLVASLNAMPELPIQLEVMIDEQGQQVVWQSEANAGIYAGLRESLSAKLAQFTQVLENRLEQKVVDQLSLTEQQGDVLRQMDGDLSGVEQQLNQLLSAQLENQLQDRLKDKIKEKLGELF